MTSASRLSNDYNSEQFELQLLYGDLYENGGGGGGGGADGDLRYGGLWSGLLGNKSTGAEDNGDSDSAESDRYTYGFDPNDRTKGSFGGTLNRAIYPGGTDPGGIVAADGMCGGLKAVDAYTSDGTFNEFDSLPSEDRK